MARAALMETARQAIQLNVRDDQYVSNIYPDPVIPFDGYHLLWRRGVALPGPNPFRNVGQPLSPRYRITAKSACAGHVDAVGLASGTNLLTGWAWDKASGRAASSMSFSARSRTRMARTLRLGTRACFGCTRSIQAQAIPFCLPLLLTENAMRSSSKVVSGSGVAGLPREDVRAAVPDVTSPNVGWHGFVRSSGPVEIRAYAILADEKTACEIPGGPFLQ